MRLFLKTGAKEIRAIGENASGDVNIYRLRKRSYSATPVTDYINNFYDLRFEYGMTMTATAAWRDANEAERARMVYGAEAKIWAEMMRLYPELEHERIPFNPTETT